ncbi:MAG TPA: hypothetical protein GYA07_00030, partial [Verrucomicrobia bacterium]|nr:hypothetical protein [Verrucomicrobiota bacterium]
GSPDIVNYGAGAATSLTMTLADNMVVGFVQTPQLTASFANIGTITIYPQDLDSFTSSDTNVVAIDPLGRLTAVGPGSATITATLAGLPAQTATINVTASNPELKHRYSFNEEPGATTLTDSVGGAHATVVGPNVILGGGEAFLNNTGGYETASYIDLPDGIISARSNITIELWYTWTRTEGNQQRLFDFGSSTKADGYATNTGSGLTWLSLSPIEWGNAMQLLYSTNGNPPQLTLSAPRSPANEEVHVAVIYAPDSGLSRIYVNGVPRATGTAPARLSDLVDINNWLGVSQWDDTPFGGRYNEFRIWEGVLTDLDIALSRHAGPDASVVGNAGELQSIEVPDQVLLIGNPANAQAILHANFENYQGVEIQSISGVSFQSLDTNVFTSTSGGSLNDVALGTAELVASYSGLTATGTVSVIAPTSVTLGLTNRMKAGGLPVNAILTADFTSTITNVNVTGFEGVTWSSSDTNVAAVSATGQVTPKNPGVAVITASYGGRTDDVTLTVELPAGFTKGQLIHRYSFNEAPDTTTVTDSVGGAHGTVINLVPGSAEDNFNGLGQLVMSGTGNSGSPGSAYVDLPNGLVSGLSAVTIEGWVVWRSEVQHTRFFDFGNSNAGEGSAGTGQGYMMFSPWSGSSRTRFAIKQGTQAETPSLASSVALTAGPDLIHYAVVYDPPNGVVRIYINGQRTGTAAVSLLLSVVQDVNNWLGRSQWSGDAMLNGLYDEFRIYNGPLLDADIAASYAAGPDALPADAPALKIRAELPNLILSWSAEAEGFELEAADDVSGPYSSAGLPAPQQVGDEYQVTVPASGQSRFFRLSK